MWTKCKQCDRSVKEGEFCLLCRTESTQECLDKAISENRSLQNKIDGGVETVKGLHKEIDQLKTDKAELVKAFKEQVDTINKLIYEQQRGK